MLSISKVPAQVDPEDDRSEVATTAAATATKVALGYVPAIGPILSEMVSLFIPDLKKERLITFAEVLGERVKDLETGLVEAKMKTEEFADLLEDALRQVARTSSPERREYIASLLRNSITKEELRGVEQRKLLSLLGELNDAEVLILKRHSLYPNQRREFVEIHKELFTPLRRHFGAPQSEVDRSALRDGYQNRLVELGLLASVHQKPKKGEIPEFDEKTGRLKSISLNATPLGKLLLRYIDQDTSAVGSNGNEESRNDGTVPRSGDPGDQTKREES